MADGGDGVTVLGVFAADCAFRAERMPRMGETILGQGFALGPGGKGSNQAVAASRAGARARLITKLGDDAFGALARQVWADAGVEALAATPEGGATGAAFIFLDAATGDNAIIAAPGAAATLSPADVDAAAEAIRGAAVFVTQLEQPLTAAVRALEIARAAGRVTILNPAPAAALDDATLALCDWVTPNESEAAALTGLPVVTGAQAQAAAEALIARGAGAVALTMGAEGVLIRTADSASVIPAFDAGPVVETTGAGDAFNGAFAAALAEGLAPLAAARFACAAASISVTRPGAAASSPTRAEIEALLAR